MGHLLWWCVIFVLGFLSLSQAFEGTGHEFVQINIISRQRLRSLRPHFQVGKGYFYYFISLFFSWFVNFMYYLGFYGKVGKNWLDL